MLCLGKGEWPKKRRTSKSLMTSAGNAPGSLENGHQKRKKRTGPETNDEQVSTSQ